MQVKNWFGVNQSHGHKGPKDIENLSELKKYFENEEHETMIPLINVDLYSKLEKNIMSVLEEFEFVSIVLLFDDAIRKAATNDGEPNDDDFVNQRLFNKASNIAAACGKKIHLTDLLTKLGVKYNAKKKVPYETADIHILLTNLVNICIRVSFIERNETTNKQARQLAVQKDANQREAKQANAKVMLELLDEIDAAPPTARHNDEGNRQLTKRKKPTAKSAQTGEGGTTSIGSSSSSSSLITSTNESNGFNQNVDKLLSAIATSKEANEANKKRKTDNEFKLGVKETMNAEISNLNAMIGNPNTSQVVKDRANKRLLALIPSDDAETKED